MRSITVTAAIAAAMTYAGSAAAGPAATIYAFTGSTDGGFPQAGLIADAQGNFYGTTTSDGSGHNGVMFELSPPAKGQKSWTQTTLYAFTGGNDGGIPQAAVTMDANGVLYGTTYAGGADGNGVAFSLTPAKTGAAWTEKVLWTFTGGNDGSEPSGSLIFDAAGNLYGTTTGGGTGVVGTVFELSPPAKGQKAWTESVLYNFTGNNDGGEPFGNVLFGSDGNLYGSSAGYGQYNYGTLYKLTAPNGGGSWQFSVLHAFADTTDGEVPRAGLIQGPDGTLYGTTAGFDTSYGTVFSLNTDGSGFKTLFNVKGGQGFTGNGPWSSVALDASGALYGATIGDGKSAYGEVFKLTPPAAGKSKWAAKVLHVFQAGAKGQFPYSSPLVSNGFIYGTTYGSAGESGFYPGTVWRIKQ